MLYLPTGTPYLPRGTLKEVLAYPLETEKFPEPGFANSLHRMGLERLVPLLNETRRWDRELSQDEQLNLALARIVMQSPQWPGVRAHVVFARGIHVPHSSCPTQTRYISGLIRLVDFRRDTPTNIRKRWAQ